MVKNANTSKYTCIGAEGIVSPTTYSLQLRCFPLLPLEQIHHGVRER